MEFFEATFLLERTKEIYNNETPDKIMSSSTVLKAI